MRQVSHLSSDGQTNVQQNTLSMMWSVYGLDIDRGDTTSHHGSSCSNSERRIGDYHDSPVSPPPRLSAGATVISTTVLDWLQDLMSCILFSTVGINHPPQQQYTPLRASIVLCNTISRGSPEKVFGHPRENYISNQA